MSANPIDFTEPLGAILRLLESGDIPHVLIGGIAVSQLGRPRATADIDLLVLIADDARIAELADRAAGSGFAGRVNDAVAFARRSRVLLLRHTATGIPVDLSLGFLPFEAEVIERRVVQESGGLRLPLPTVEDLIILKAVARRPRDLQDIGMLVDANPALDRARVRKIVSDFAALLETPEMLEEVEALLVRAGPA